VYTPKELDQISQLAKKNNMFVHMDGARIANAVAALNGKIKDAVRGVDVLSFGGTKNGIMFGEAVVFFNKKLAENFCFNRKQKMQLSSKMRFIAAQFDALLSDNLWLKNAEHSNRMAQALLKKVKTISNAEVVQPVDANAVFVRLLNTTIKKLAKNFRFYVWEVYPGGKTSVVRLMTSFDTTLEDIDGLFAGQ